MSAIEINIRHRSDGAMLNIYLDRKTKAALIAALESGQFADSNTPINIELSVLPEWLSEPGSTHARIPISEINISTDD
ncbi:hypothetical protein [Aquipseudomonas alcaligenes]|uniref:Uncharacterized protein n=1 Tax=Aquipseudomonas alcaligenes TaxID=43263 RepID=A0A1N6WD31_AQUAC|nr:hypothetical protein [Pseudomonas alcaligenes]SIQ87876.1 hypothetical protein SAMN05878282_109116 [Pseudomonas alcaligenes]